MKRFLVFILLACYMNTSMFLPQMAEVDVFDANGNQVDDINSVVEYISVALGIDHTADDEDDDSGQNFHLVLKPITVSCPQVFIPIEHKIFAPVKVPFCCSYKDIKLQMISFDILTPPPDRA